MFGIFHGRPPPVSPVDLRGKDAIVTGASAGLGLETARYLARFGARVTLIGRDPARTERVARDIQACLERAEADQVVGLTCDFASLAAVRALAAQLLSRHAQLHILVNNAGLWLQSQERSAEGHEKTFAVNHLAPFLLTQLLLPRMKESGAARVVNVSSRLHVDAPPPDARVLRDPPRFVGIQAYAASKLCNVLFSHELAARLEGTDVTSNAVHPGDVATDVTRSSKVLSFLSDRVGKPFLLTPEEGARTSVHVATHPALLRTTGRYFVNCTEAPASKYATDAALRRKLWEDSERLVSS